MKDALALYYLFFFGLFLPYMSLKALYGKKKDKPIPPKAQLRLSVIANLVLFGLVALMVAYVLRLPIFPVWQLSPAET